MVITAIRERASGWVVWIIVGLICVTFALWGIQSYFEGLNRVVVAEVDGEEIDYDTYQRSLSQRRQNMIRTFGNRVDPSMFAGPEFKRATVEELVGQRLLLADIEQSGYRISDAQLNTLIKNFPAFQDTDGNFSKPLYEQVLRSQGMTPASFEQAQRQQNAVDQIRNGFAQSAFVTEAELNQAVALAEQTRESDVALIPLSQFSEGLEISDEDAKAEYDANQESYRAPDKIKVEFVELSVNKLMADVTVSDEELQTAYDATKQQYLDEERRQARHILIKLPEDADADADQKALAKIEDLLTKAKAGEDFAELAKANSEDTGSAIQGGDLGLVNRGVMVKPFEDALFAMEDGAISEEPVRSRFGYHIIKLEEIQAQRVKEFAEVREEILKAEKRRQAEERFASLSEGFRNVVFEQPNSLEPAASEIGATVNTSDWVERNKGAGLFGQQSVRTAAFSEDVLTEGLNSEVVEVDIDTLIAMRKVEYEESKIQPIEDVRTRIDSVLKQKKTNELAEAKAKELATRIEGGEAWEDVLAEAELTSTAGPEKRTSATTPTDRALAALLFEAAAPKDGKPVVGSGSVAGTHFAVYRLKEVKAGDPASVEDQAKEQIEAQIRRRAGDEAFLAYQTALREKANVVIVDEVLADDYQVPQHNYGQGGGGAMF